MTTFDASGVIPEARHIAEQAAATYIRHTAPWFIGLVAHGSAVKGGYIGGCSDIDFQLYLDDAAFSADKQLPLELCLAIHHDLAAIDPAPFQYIQCYAHSTRLPADYVGPIPGVYRVVAGRVPVPEATAEQLLVSARTSLAKLNPRSSFGAGALLQRGGGKLERQVRLLCTQVWPVLYQILALQTGDPIRVWALPKPSALQLMSETDILGRRIRQFFSAICAYYPAEEPVEQGLAAIAAGIGFLQAAGQWWGETGVALGARQNNLGYNRPR